MIGRQVIHHGGKHVRTTVTLMRSNVIVTVINIYLALAVKNSNPLADVVIRNTVIVFIFVQANVVGLGNRCHPFRF